ncbi:MAG: hypothetical protein KGZ71_08480 [Desulfobulbaceae bacterium]|nr:hypothetical protein [Candidatus Kapabacteria bacterium]MBS4000502.1 hypothetical protein [Desulfobulbaceae bacterium]
MKQKDQLNREVLKFILLAIIFAMLGSSIAYTDDWRADSIRIQPVDKVADTTSKWPGIILIGGGGIAYFSEYISYYFHKAPVVNLGIEIPFTKSHIYALEIMTHSWLARVKDSAYKGDYLNRNYFQYNQNHYTQIGISAVLRGYIVASKVSKFRVFWHFGWLFWGKKDYNSLDLGLGLNYKFTDVLRLQFSYRILSGIPNIADGSTFTTPNLLLLNVCYKL